MAAPFVSVVIPTYQERANVERVVRDASAALGPRPHEIVVVDDASPDGTADVVDALGDAGLPARAVRRVGERGLASAVLHGFRHAKGDVLVVMDADGSHPAELLPALVDGVAEGADVCVASRYAPGGGIEGWPWRRRLVSAMATRLAAHLTPVRDPLSGFFAVKRDVVEGQPLDPRGFKVGLDILVRGDHARVKEVPFVFRDRAQGKSKLHAGVFVDYVRHLWELTRAANPVAFQAAKYLVVGGLGILVNLAVFSLLLYLGGVAAAAAAVGSFVAALLFNFALNRLWTFQDPPRRASTILRQVVTYAIVAVGGLGINLMLLELLTGRLGAHALVGQTGGILAGAAWNFELSRRLVFRGAAQPGAGATLR